MGPFRKSTPPLKLFSYIGKQIHLHLIKMRLYSDLLTDDEYFTDATKFKEMGDFPGLYEVEGKFVSRKVDSIDESSIGGNASAEEAADDMDDGPVISGINIILDSKLELQQFDKKSYMAHIKDYMKAVKKHLEKVDADKVDSFMKNASKIVKEFILPNLKKFEFFTGPSLDENSMVVLCKWNDDETIPFLYYWKDAVRDEKV